MIKRDEPIKDVIEQCEIEHLDFPDWFAYLCEIGDHGPITVEDIQAINQGGCSSGAFMPAVTYHTALKCMNEHGDDIFEEIEECIEYIELDIKNKSWAGLAVLFVSVAVENWCATAENVLYKQ